MKKELWLARESHKMGWYGIFRGEPTPNQLKAVPNDMLHNVVSQSNRHGVIKRFSSEAFHALTTTRLRKGRKRKIKRILIELEK